MILAIGTKNPIKIQAVTEVLKDYPLFAQAEIQAFEVLSHISEQPLSLEETIKGAKNRAKHAYEACGDDCAYSIGLESGLFEAPGTQTGYLEASVCCIYDGENIHIGTSSGFELPPAILELVLTKQLDLSQACYESGITTHVKLGASEGLVGLLTKGRINRKENTKQCMITALIQLENPAWFVKSANLS